MKFFYRGLLAVTLTFSLVIFFSVGKTQAKGGVYNAKGVRVLAVDVYRVPKPKDMPVELEYPARLKSVRRVTITARVSGILLRKFYTEGRFVKKGKLLYQIEPDTYQAAAQAAEAQLRSALADFDKAQRDWKRVKVLYENNATSQRKRDAALSAYEIAKAGIDKAKANLKTASINLNYTNVKATISGVTGLKLVDVGDLVSNGTKLTTITQINPIYAEFSIPDVNIIKQKYYIKNGRWSKPADGRIKAALKINGRWYNKEGYINFIDTNIDPQTSTVRARAVFKNPNGYLMPGEFVRIVLKGLVRKNVIMVPQRAVLQNPLGTIVFVADKGKVQVRPVKLGETSGKYYIINWGLKPGDLVIVDNCFKIRPQMPVKIDKIVNKGQ